MHSSSEALGFLHWIGISHYLNLLLVGFTVRSGLEIPSAHPKTLGARPRDLFEQRQRHTMRPGRL